MYTNKKIKVFFIASLIIVLIIIYTIGFHYNNTSNSNNGIKHQSIKENTTTRNNNTNTVIKIPSLSKRYVNFSSWILPQHFPLNKLGEVLYEKPGAIDNLDEVPVLDSKQAIPNSSILYSRVLETLKGLGLSTKNLHIGVLELYKVSWSLFGFRDTVFCYLWEVNIVYGNPSITSPYLHVIITYESLNGTPLLIQFSKFFYRFITSEKYSWIVEDKDKFYNVVRWKPLTKKNMTNYLAVILRDIIRYEKWRQLFNDSKVIMVINSSYEYSFQIEIRDPCDNTYKPIYQPFMHSIRLIYYTEDISGDERLLNAIMFNIPLFGNVSLRCRMTTLDKSDAINKALQFLKDKYNISRNYVKVTKSYQVYYWHKPWILSNYWCIELWIYGVKKYYAFIIIDPITGDIYDYGIF